MKDSTGPSYRTIEVVFCDEWGRWHKAAARRRVGDNGYWHQLGTGYSIDGLPGAWQPPKAEHYMTLGVPAGASQEEVKRAWKRFAAAHHPDRGGDAETFKRGRAAYEALVGNYSME